MIFRIRSPVDERIDRRSCPRIHEVLPVSSFRDVMFRREVVSHLKYPGAKITARFASLQMPEQGQKNFLNDLFRVWDAQADT